MIIILLLFIFGYLAQHFANIVLIKNILKKKTIDDLSLET